MKKKTLLLCLSAALLMGARPMKLRVTYVSDPPGAALYQSGQLMGYTPLTLHYEVSAADKKAGVTRLLGTEVRWASGATARVEYLTADLEKNGKNQQFTFQRPDVPGRTDDIQVGLRMQELAILQQQASAQQAAAVIQRQALIYQTIVRPIVQPPRSCTSIVLGNIVSTTC